MTDKLQTAKTSLASVRAEVATTSERLAAARAAFADAEQKRREVAVKAATGDQAAIKSLKAATRDRDDAAQLIEDLVLAAGLADEKLASAMAETDSQHYLAVREKIVALGADALTRLAKVKEIGAELSEVFGQMRECDAAIQALLRTTLAGSGIDLIPSDHHAYTAQSASNILVARTLLMNLPPELRAVMRNLTMLPPGQSAEPSNVWEARLPETRPPDKAAAKPAEPQEIPRVTIRRLEDGVPVQSIYPDASSVVVAQGPDFSRVAV